MGNIFMNKLGVKAEPTSINTKTRFKDVAGLA
jgi:hypothetical protein